MIQSARSGKKDILEGSKASVTSKETEIKLTNVARASLEELLDDYLDYLRVRDLPIGTRAPKKPATCERSDESSHRHSKITVSSVKRGRQRWWRTHDPRSLATPKPSTVGSRAQEA